MYKFLHFNQHEFGAGLQVDTRYKPSSLESKIFQVNLYSRGRNTQLVVASHKQMNSHWSWGSHHRKQGYNYHLIHTLKVCSGRARIQKWLASFACRRQNKWLVLVCCKYGLVGQRSARKHTSQITFYVCELRPEQTLKKCHMNQLGFHASGIPKCRLMAKGRQSDWNLHY